MRFEIVNKSYASSVLLIVCKVLNLDISDVVSKKRYPELVRCRAMVSKLLKDKKESLEAIGLIINKDHSTIIHLLKRHEDFMYYKDYNTLYNSLTNKEMRLTIIEKISYHRTELDRLINILCTIPA